MKVDKLFVATKAFIVNEKGEVLIVRENFKYEDGTNEGKFDIVGGRVEPGQRFDESLKREIREETGLEVEIDRPFHVGEWRPNVRGEQWQIVATFFKCKALSKEVKMGDDHSEYKWIDPRSYGDYPVIENLKEAFEDYLT